MAPPISKEKRREVVATLQRIKSAKGTARLCGITLQTAWRIAKEYGIELATMPQRSSRKPSAEEIAKLTALLERCDRLQEREEHEATIRWAHAVRRTPEQFRREQAEICRG